MPTHARDEYGNVTRRAAIMLIMALFGVIIGGGVAGYQTSEHKPYRTTEISDAVSVTQDDLARPLYKPGMYVYDRPSFHHP